MTKNLVFRRINGRVIPIHKSPIAKQSDQKNVKTGPKTSIALSMGTAIGSGLISSAQNNQAARVWADYKDLKFKGEKFKGAANAALREYKRFSASSSQIRTGGALLAAGMAGYGADKLVQKSKYKDDSNIRFLAAGGATVAAFAAARFAYGFGTNSNLKLIQRLGEAFKYAKARAFIRP